MNRLIITYGNYFMDFYATLDNKVQEKIDYVFELIKTVDLVPKRFFKHMEGAEGLFEIRVEYESNIYRILCFFDEGNIIVLINSFQKKSQKTPRRVLALANELKKQYSIDKIKSLKNEKGSKAKK